MCTNSKCRFQFCYCFFFFLVFSPNLINKQFHYFSFLKEIFFYQPSCFMLISNSLYNIHNNNQHFFSLWIIIIYKIQTNTLKILSFFFSFYQYCSIYPCVCTSYKVAYIYIYIKRETISNFRNVWFKKSIS